MIDLPGCILHPREGETDNTPDDIMQLVKEQISPPHRCAVACTPSLTRRCCLIGYLKCRMWCRLILFLQQSSVEWCSSLWCVVRVSLVS